jgi:5-methylcytosine-specific restriction protein B
MKAKPTNLILFGPPGTGKTYVTAQHAVSICQGRPLDELAKESYRDQLMADYRKLSEAGNIAFVTFHQTYDYTDFVEGLRPQVTPDKRMTYELVPGVLRRLAALATSPERRDQQFVLIIDEINRGTVSKILGELITLIETDKRLDAKNELHVTLPISGDTFGLPLNLHLIGTMNTADRSIALIDTALRRRFDFIAMDPKPEVLDSRTYVGDVQPSDFLRALNTKLAGVFRDREHAIGHAWFMPDGEKPQTQAQVLKAFKDKVVPTLTEWLWDSPEKLREILGDDVVDEYGKVDPAKLTDKCLADMVGNATKPSAAS